MNVFSSEVSYSLALVLRARNPSDEIKPLFHWTHPRFTGDVFSVKGEALAEHGSGMARHFEVGWCFILMVFCMVDGMIGDAWSTILVMVGPHVWNVVPK